MAGFSDLDFFKEEYRMLEIFLQEKFSDVQSETAKKIIAKLLTPIKREDKEI